MVFGAGADRRDIELSRHQVRIGLVKLGATITFPTVMLTLLANVAAQASDVITNCRESQPPTCQVADHPAAQALFRERCTQNPEHCSFRPNGTISQWSPKLEIPPGRLLDALNDRAQRAREALLNRQ